MQNEPVLVGYLSAVQAYVGTPSLAAHRQGELVGVGPQIADVMQHCGTGV
jgi:hypothetical protein